MWSIASCFFLGILFGSSAERVGNRHIEVTPINLDWGWAQSHCRAEGMVLLQIYKEEESKQVAEIARRYHPSNFWLGAKKRGNL